MSNPFVLSVIHLSTYDGMAMKLELLPQDKVYIASSYWATSIGLVKAVAPVNTHQSYHR